MLKKFSIATAITFFTIIFAAESCSASIALVRLTIGGITLGAEMDFVKSIFGEPVKIYETSVVGERDACHEYIEPSSTDKNAKNKHLRIIYSRDRVIQIVCDGSSDLRTFDGVKIGDPVSIIKAVYGEPDDEGKIPTHFRRNIKADKYFFYNSTCSTYSLVFLAKKGKIVGIMSGLVDIGEQ